MTPPIQLDRSPYVTAWLGHRLAIGLMGIAMPLILIVGEHVLFSRDVVDFPRASLSAYYYSGLRDVFVGTLVATGVFLITFHLTRADTDNVITVVSGVAALAVAFDPTGPERGEVAPPWARLVGVHTTQVIHSVSACVFIAGLALMSARFALHTGRRALSWLHIACSVLMVAAAAAALIAGAAGVQHVGRFSGLLLVELVCTYAFGVSWLLRGLELRRELTGPAS